MTRSTALAAFLLWLAPAALADAILLKNGKLVGLPHETEDGAAITADNWKNYLDKSNAVITREGYDALEIEGKKAIPLAEVADYDFHPVPEALAEGQDQQHVGAWAQAIAALQQVASDPAAREVFKIRASFEIGRCYVASGGLKNAEQHFLGWKSKNSAFTPEVLSVLASIQKSQKKFADARATFAQIEQLPGIPKSWIMRARLGGVGVEIEERSFAQAEAKAKQIIGEIGADATLNDALALAHAQLARAIQQAGNKERLEEARGLLEKAGKLPGVSDGNRAFLYATLGDVLYLQGDPDNARLPYMRVVEMYDEPAFRSHSLFNAGQCFLDLHERVERDPAKDPEQSKYYLREGVKLLTECILKYGAYPAAQDARRVYAGYKKKYDEIK
ncbi:MAG: hypothetical protein ACREID_02550 [Planctomycetota bacterium]